MAKMMFYRVQNSDGIKLNNFFGESLPICLTEALGLGIITKHSRWRLWRSG